MLYEKLSDLFLDSEHDSIKENSVCADQLRITKEGVNEFGQSVFEQEPKARLHALTTLGGELGDEMVDGLFCEAVLHPLFACSDLVFQ